MKIMLHFIYLGSYDWHHTQVSCVPVQQAWKPRKIALDRLAIVSNSTVLCVRLIYWATNQTGVLINSILYSFHDYWCVDWGLVSFSQLSESGIRLQGAFRLKFMTGNLEIQTFAPLISEPDLRSKQHCKIQSNKLQGNVWSIDTVARNIRWDFKHYSNINRFLLLLLIYYCLIKLL